MFLNLSGYDSHIFIKTLGNSEGDISCIPNNEDFFHETGQVDKFLNKEGKKLNVKGE